MDIYPKDLGPEGHAAIQETRAVFPGERTAQSAPKFDGFVLAGFYLILGVFTVGTAHATTWPLAVLGAFAIGILAFVSRPHRRKAVEPLEKPLAVHEVQYVAQTAKDALTHAFYELAVTAIHTPSTEDGEADRSVREALQALGASIAELSLTNAHDAKDDPAALKAEGERLRAALAAEQDPVVAASIGRRADALARQAEMAARTGLLLRRNEALRQEVSDQIGALRTSLTAIRVGGRQSAGELADVAASIQSVAIEAGALTQARDEMERLVSRVQGSG